VIVSVPEELNVFLGANFTAISQEAAAATLDPQLLVCE
jgi:hypothetical protein